MCFPSKLMPLGIKITALFFRSDLTAPTIRQGIICCCRMHSISFKVPSGTAITYSMLKNEGMFSLAKFFSWHYIFISRQVQACVLVTTINMSRNLKCEHVEVEGSPSCQIRYRSQSKDQSPALSTTFMV